MKSCRGCKYLVRAAGRDVCRANDGQWYATENPYTGRIKMEHIPHPDRPSILRETVEEMRSFGRCGPDATLWTPNIWRRLWKRLTASKSGEVK